MSTYLYEVDEMVILVVGTDGDEEFLEWSLLPLGQSPGFHIKSRFLEPLPEMIPVCGVLPLDVMSACLNMNICCPGLEDGVLVGVGWDIDTGILLDVVHLGHPEGVVLGVGVEPTGESDIIHCRYG